MKQKLSELNEEMHKFTITVDLNTLVSATDRTIWQKISKDVEDLNNAVYQQVNMTLLELSIQ